MHLQGRLHWREETEGTRAISKILRIMRIIGYIVEKTYHYEARTKYTSRNYDLAKCRGFIKNYCKCSLANATVCRIKNHLAARKKGSRDNCGTGSYIHMYAAGILSHAIHPTHIVR